MQSAATRTDGLLPTQSINMRTHGPRPARFGPNPQLHLNCRGDLRRGGGRVGSGAPLEEARVQLAERLSVVLADQQLGTPPRPRSAHSAACRVPCFTRAHDPCLHCRPRAARSRPGATSAGSAGGQHGVCAAAAALCRHQRRVQPGAGGSAAWRCRKPLQPSRHRRTATAARQQPIRHARSSGGGRRRAAGSAAGAPLRPQQQQAASGALAVAGCPQPGRLWPGFPGAVSLPTGERTAFHAGEKCLILKKKY